MGSPWQPQGLWQVFNQHPIHSHLISLITGRVGDRERLTNRGWPSGLRHNLQNGAFSHSECVCPNPEDHCTHNLKTASQKLDIKYVEKKSKKISLKKFENKFENKIVKKSPKISPPNFWSIFFQFFFNLLKIFSANVFTN